MFGLLNKLFRSMKSMFEKECGIKSNGNFMEFEAYCNNCGDPENEPVYRDINIDNKSIDKATSEVLNLSRDLFSNKKCCAFFTKDAMKKQYNDYVKNLCEKFGYKTKNAAFKNMMSISIILKENRKLHISPWLHEKLEYWTPIHDTNIDMSFSAPPELLGAAVRFAFSRCKGKGPYAKGAEIVTKALFPDGVPNSLEEYLESIDKDYKKWLISC